MSIPSINVRLAILAGCIIGATFFPYVHRPYSLTSDIAYQAFSARQYVDHEVSALNDIRLADPGDLSKDLQSSSNFWPPCWPYLFTLAYKAGLAPGPAGRILVLLLSVAGALGWIWVTSILGIKGLWRIAGVATASLYCLRTDAVATLGAGDIVVYAVAPWLLGPAICLGNRQPPRLDRRTVFQTALLALAFGSVYWLKYSAVFLGVPVLSALVLGQFFIRPRRPVLLLAAVSLYGAAFVAPIVANKAYEDKVSGTDLLESATRPDKPARTLDRLAGLTSQALYNLSTTLFSTQPGVDRVTRNRSQAIKWSARLPGLILLAMLLLFTLWYPPGFLRTLVALTMVTPLVGFPILSFVIGLQFTAAISRVCGPFWILLELFILMLFSQSPHHEGPIFRRARIGLAIIVGSQVLFFLWIPIGAAEELRFMYHDRPPYQAGEAGLWVPDLSKFGTRNIDSQVRSLMRSPNDVVVPAIYSNRSFGMDTWLEFGGRLLPLNTYVFRQSNRDGADFFGTSPFRSSRPLRVILVASNIFERKDFPALVQNIKDRFVQAREWTQGQEDPDGRVQIWVTDLP